MANRVKGIAIELSIDGSKATKWLASFQTQVKKSEGSLKDLEKSLKLNPANADLLKQKFEILGETIEKTKTYLSNLKNEYDKLAGKQDPTAKDIEQMRNLQREISDTEKKLSSLQRQYDSFGSVGAQQIKAVGTQMQELGKKISSAGSDLTSLGMQLERLGAPLQAAFGYGIKETMSFEQSMANVQAVTQSSQEDFGRLEKAAIDMSKQTIYSADETAEALYYMGLSGWDANQSIAALPGVLDLAAAGQVDLGNASSIVVDGMNAMGMEITGYTGGVANATHFTNVMAAAMSNSNTTVDLLGESFKYAAPLAGSLEYSIDDLTLGLGLMASSGIKGSQAGTGLRMALKNLSNPTEKQAAAMEKFNISMEDGYGNALPFRDVIDQFRDSFGGMNLELVDSEGNLKTGEQLMEEYGDSLPATQMDKFRAVAEIVGVRALPGILGMVNASPEAFDKLKNAIDNADGSFVKIRGDVLPLTEAVDKYGQSVVNAEGETVGYAEYMRNIQLGTAQGQIQLLKDNFSALAIEIGKEVIPYIIDFANWLSGLIDKFRALDPETQQIILTIAAVIAAAGPVLVTIGQIATGIGGLISLIGSIVSGIGTALGVIQGFIAIVGAGPALIVAAVVGALAFIITHWEEFKAAIIEVWNSIKEFAVALWDGIKWVFEDTWNAIRDFFVETAEKIQEKWQAFKDKIGEILDKLREKWEEFKQKIVDLVEALRQKWEDFKTKLAEIFERIKERIENLRQKWEDFKEKIRALVENLRQKWEDFKQKIADIFAAIKEKIENLRQKWEEFKERIRDIVDAVRQKIEDMRESIREKIDAIREKIETLKEKWESLKQKVIDIKDAIVGKIDDLRSRVQNTFADIRRFMEDPIGSAKRFIDDKIQAIKNLFPLNIGNIFKNIRLPHIEWGWKDVGGIVSIPSFSISWYAKAMKNGMLLDGATIFGAQGGKLLGGGEVGKEWVVGHNSLQSMINGAVARGSLSTDAIYDAVVAGMQAANVTVYMDSTKVTKQITKTIAQEQASRQRFLGAY